MTRLLLNAGLLAVLIIRYGVWMPARWARLSMLALFLMTASSGFFWSADAHKPPQPRPSSPLPALKPDPAAVWNALAAEEARLARALRLEMGR